MSSEMLILLSCTLTFGAPLLLAARELLVLRRSGGGPGGGSPERDRVPPTPPPPSPVGVRPLPDCLIPKPLPVRTVRPRELEHA